MTVDDAEHAVGRVLMDAAPPVSVNARSRAGTVRRVADSSNEWTFLTNHAHVLIAIAGNPDLRLRDIADQVGITERTAVGIVSDLEADGYITREKVGRRNHYVLDPSRPLRHPLEAHHTISELIEAIDQAQPPVSDG